MPATTLPMILSIGHQRAVLSTSWSWVIVRSVGSKLPAPSGLGWSKLMSREYRVTKPTRSGSRSPDEWGSPPQFEYGVDNDHGVQGVVVVGRAVHSHHASQYLTGFGDQECGEVLWSQPLKASGSTWATPSHDTKLAIKAGPSTMGPDGTGDAGDEAGAGLTRPPANA